MKQILTTFAILLLLPLMLSASAGRITVLSSGAFRIEYPGQIIHLYFDVFPNGASGHRLQTVDMDVGDRLSMVQQLRNAMDELPETLINKYLGIDVYLLNIGDEHVLHSIYHDEFTIEITPPKLERHGFATPVYPFLCAVGQRLLDESIYHGAIQELLTYLDRYYDEHRCMGNLMQQDLFDCGYVSMRAAGFNGYGYSSKREFSELFASLFSADKKHHLMDHIHSHPDAGIKEKVEMFLGTMKILVPSIDDVNLYTPAKTIVPTGSQPIETGEALLSIHEYKSGQSAYCEEAGIIEEPLPGPNMVSVPPPEEVSFDHPSKEMASLESSLDAVERDLEKREQEIREKKQMQDRQKKDKNTKRRRKAILWSTLIVTLLILI